MPPINAVPYTREEKELFKEIIEQVRQKQYVETGCRSFTKGRWPEVQKLFNESSVVQTKRTIKQLSNLHSYLIYQAMGKKRGPRIKKQPNVSKPSKFYADPSYRPSTSKRVLDKCLRVSLTRLRLKENPNDEREDIDPTEYLKVVMGEPADDLSETPKVEVTENSPPPEEPESAPEEIHQQNEAETEAEEEARLRRELLERMKRKLTREIEAKKALVMSEKDILVKSFERDVAVANYHKRFINMIATKKIQHIETIGHLKMGYLSNQEKLNEIRENLYI